MRINKDLSGIRVGNFTVLHRIFKPDDKHSFYECLCDCGNIFIKRADMIKNAKHKACNNCKRVRTDMIKHNMSRSRIYNIYYNVKSRCYNKNNPCYKNYGGRGIKMCKQWFNKETGFINFYNWCIANGYDNRLTLDRIDNNGNYEPSNCRWISMKKQENNKRTNIYITYKNITKPITEWSEILGLSYDKLYYHYQLRHKSIDNIINRYCKDFKINE